MGSEVVIVKQNAEVGLADLLREVALLQTADHEMIRPILVVLSLRAASYAAMAFLPHLGMARLNTAKVSQVVLSLLDLLCELEPLITTRAFSNDWKPSIGCTRLFTRRWSCSTMLLR